MQLSGSDRTRAVIFSVALHALVAAIVVFSIDFHGRPEPLPPDAGVRIVEAVAVDEKTVRQEIERLKAADEKQRLDAERAAGDAEKKRKQEEEKLKKLKAEQKRIEQKKAEERKKLEAEKKRLAEEKKKLEEQQRKRAEEQKRLEEAEKKRKAEAERTEQALKDALEAEERETAAAEQLRRDQVEIARYIAAIQNKVANVFIYPDLEEGLTCTLFVRMIPGGEVVETRVIESSGNPSFDRQAENAVRKAAPLPAPSDLRLFERMREIRFVFDPEQ
jgi:colicin import membrane protein